MSQLKIRLFGKFSLLCGDREQECLPSSKAKELFCYLLLHRDRSHSREVLASVLWGDCTTAQSRKYFRQTLWQLHQALKNAPGGQADAMQVDVEHVRLNSEAEFSLDIAIFEAAFAPVRGVKGEQIGDQQAQALRNAVSLYSGDLLEGWFQDWCIYHRERLQNIYLAILDKLMGYSEFHRQYEDGLSFGERLLRQDSARERTYFRLMRLHYLAGDRAGALRQFQRCAAALETELGVKPGERTLQLYEAIRTDQFRPAILPESERNSSSLSKPAFSSYFSRLKRLRSLLLKLQHRVEEDILEVDQALTTRTSPSASPKH